MTNIDEIVELQTAIIEKLHRTWIVFSAMLRERGISEKRDKEVFDALKEWGKTVFEAGESRGFRVRHELAGLGACICLVGVELRPGMTVPTKSNCPVHGWWGKRKGSTNTTAPHR